MSVQPNIPAGTNVELLGQCTCVGRPIYHLQFLAPTDRAWINIATLIVDNRSFCMRSSKYRDRFDRGLRVLICLQDYLKPVPFLEVRNMVRRFAPT